MSNNNCLNDNESVMNKAAEFKFSKQTDGNVYAELFCFFVTSDSTTELIVHYLKSTKLHKKTGQKQ